MHLVQAGTGVSLSWYEKNMSYGESFWQDGLPSEGSISHSEILTTLLERRHSLAQPAASWPDLSIRLDVKIFGSSIQHTVPWSNDSQLTTVFGMEIQVCTKQSIHSSFGGDHPAAHFILNSPFVTSLCLPLILVFSWLLVQGGVYGAIKFHSSMSNKKCCFLLEMHFHWTFQLCLNTELPCNRE